MQILLVFVVLMQFRVLLATIKFFGGCPCPRCFIEKAQIPDMGTKADMRRRQNTRQDTPWYRSMIETARRWIFDKGYLVGGAAVSRLLKPKSWVPTRVRISICFDHSLLCTQCLYTSQNAFSKLAPHGFNFFSMFVPDLLHEVELGSWKSLFTHLIRILYAYSPISVEKLDER